MEEINPAGSRLRNNPPKKIAVLRAQQLGDMLCSVPAFRALRHQFPQAEITLIGLPWANTFVKRFDRYLDRFMEFPSYPGLLEREPAISCISGFFHHAQAEKFDLAIQLQGGGSYENSVAMLLAAKKTAGFYSENEYCPDEELYMIYPENESSIWQPLRLMQHLGIILQGDHLEFPSRPEDEEEYSVIDPDCRPGSNPYVCLHPGAQSYKRRWNPEYFAACADSFAQSGYEVVITGSRDEADFASLVCELMKSQAFNLAGRTTQGALAHLLRNARLLVGGDTSISHLAAALDVPSVTLAPDSDSRGSVLDPFRHKILNTGTDGERPSVGEVLDVSRQLLSLVPETGEKRPLMIGNFKGVWA